MKLVRRDRVTLSSLSGESKLTVEYDNLGEPFREGVLLTIDDESNYVGVLLDRDDVIRLRDALSNLLVD